VTSIFQDQYIMRIIHILFLSFFLFTALPQAFAQEQEEQKTEDSSSLENQRLAPTINLDEEEEEDKEEEEPKKKRKKGVFYGIKTKKGFVQTGFGNNEVIEQFHYIKAKDINFDELDQYVRDIYWYDTKDKRLKMSPAFKIDKENAVILHGPYKKILADNDQVLTTGIFYKGTKHGRWEYYNSKDILLDKEKYYKGWPKESIVSYYDQDRKKLKEIIPVEYGEKEGNYYYFFESGRVAVIGEFQHDQKVGVWKEYHKLRNKRKREIQYREDPFNDKFTPYIKREWDKDGKLIYEKKEGVMN
jgi:antitoxin component YwqK of YwqJK toxin-antitoxin module